MAAEVATTYFDPLPEVINLGRRNQPCLVNGNWQAHEFAEEEWIIDPRCDCLPFGGIELRCQNCGWIATPEEENIWYVAHGDPSIWSENDLANIDYMDRLPF